MINKFLNESCDFVIDFTKFAVGMFCMLIKACIGVVVIVGVLFWEGLRRLFGGSND